MVEEKEVQMEVEMVVEMDEEEKEEEEDRLGSVFLRRRVFMNDRARLSYFQRCDEEL
jgi:hypothetical protein